MNIKLVDLVAVQGIQITATTPTNNAVRLETSTIELQLSNRVRRAEPRPAAPQAPAGEAPEAPRAPKPDLPAAPKVAGGASLKVFVKARIGLNLTLGTLIKNPMFEEAEADLQPLAKFDTLITLRNALQASTTCGFY